MLSFFNTVISTTLNEYVNLISVRHGIPVDDLMKLMNELKSVNAQSHHIQTIIPLPVAPVQNAENKCGYIYLRGSKSGTVCGNKNKKNSEFCSQHTKKKEKDEVVVLNTHEVKEVAKKPNPVLRMNKIIGKWWHADTSLVFKSSEEKIVIGIFKDDKIVDLSEDDVKVCIANKFKYVMKRKIEYDEESQEPNKKQKIDEEFIKVNQSAKNVETLINEMFNHDKEYEDEIHEEEEEEDPWAYGGVAESKENYENTREEDEDAHEHEMIIDEDEDVELLEEEDS